MAARRALYLMPSFAVLATAALVLGPGRERPAVGARLWGIPADGGRAAAWRIETIERQYGADRAVATGPLDVAVYLGARRIAAWTGRSGDDGVAEALVQADEPLAGPIEVRVTSGNTLLALGPIPQRAVPPLTLEKRMIEGHAEGPIALSIEVSEGVLASPFPGAVRVHAKRSGAPAEGVVLKPTADGAEVLLTNIEPTTDAAGEASIALVPTWHEVELKLEAVDRRIDPQTKSTWEGRVPVQPGALWLGGGRPVAEVLSPVPRDCVYISGVGAKGRVFGQIVTLAKNDRGLYQGSLDMTELIRLGAEAVTVAGDPQELGSGTVTWPLFSKWSVATPPRVERLYDGIPLAERREQARARTARLASVGVALLAAFFEALLLVLVSRESQAKLAAHLAQLDGDEGERAAALRIAAAPANRAITLVVAVGLVVLGFGAVAAFAVVR